MGVELSHHAIQTASQGSLQHQIEQPHQGNQQQQGDRQMAMQGGKGRLPDLTAGGKELHLPTHRDHLATDGEAAIPVDPILAEAPLRRHQIVGGIGGDSRAVAPQPDDLLIRAPLLGAKGGGKMNGDPDQAPLAGSRRAAITCQSPSRL